MCTVILLSRPGHAWPVLIAANRDEMLDRAADPPGPWWPDRPGVVGGRDRSGGGTWMAVNRNGVVATVLNRPGSLGPAPGKRSRGELPLLALAEPDATAAAAAIAALPAAEWRSFNMVIADRHAAFFLRGLGEGRPEALPLPPGISMVTAHDPNDLTSPRTARHLPRFQAAPPPVPEAKDWTAWARLLADRDTSGDPAAPRGVALNVPPLAGFGTVSASLLALGAGGTVQWLFAPGPPDRAPFQAVPL
ncbi:NRDE family protein [Siccirubricoccus sp. KC 17139]|uniref:NRDE family protein n=1 Tax=Siccirubricoccus soli TaxID=2899147 RepID=A0ABT1D254_9PROT|nr:NRDE family protein [Siccirubricoccus soli]MCO6415977.1 NRDE family protein [Siccirubricoccus soli]MCP2682109.1 NRDE family protein [Siccirubricoccus soli]